MTPRRLWLAISIAALVVLPFILKNYQVTIAAFVLINATAALGLNVLTGYAGQISLGHAAFVALGGYGAALLQTQFGLPIWISLPVAGVLTSLFGLILVIPALRLTEIYLAIATLGFGVAVQQVIPQWDLLGGSQGLNLSRATVFDAWLDVESALGPLTLTPRIKLYFVVVVVGAILWWLTRNALRSGLGRTFVAVRDRELAAEALGISLPRTKAYAFLLSAFLTGVAGALHANVVGYINASNFGLAMSIEFLAMIAIGGIASMPGALLGAAFITLVPEVLSGFSEWIPQFVYGAALLGAILFMPYGLWGALLRLRGRSREWMTSVRELLGGTSRA